MAGNNHINLACCGTNKLLVGRTVPVALRLSAFGMELMAIVVICSRSWTGSPERLAREHLLGRVGLARVKAPTTNTNHDLLVTYKVPCLASNCTIRAAGERSRLWCV